MPTEASRIALQRESAATVQYRSAIYEPYRLYYAPPAFKVNRSYLDPSEPAATEWTETASSQARDATQLNGLERLRRTKNGQN